MALRDHSLDGKITNAAFEEFLKKGYRGASLRKIAEAAGVTVGAIQVRYKSKDELFASLLKPLLDGIKVVFEDTKADYFAETNEDILTKLKDSMKRESKAIIRLIFDHYEQSVLLLNRSAGSSFEHYFDDVVQSKIKESIAFFKNVDNPHVDEKLLGFLISVQFDSYRRIVSECSDRATAEKYTDSLMTYHLGGWTAFLLPITKEITNRRRLYDMKYNGFYFWMFKGSMKKVLAEKYGKEYAAEIMKKSKKTYKELVANADDIGDDNPMAYNELFALAFVAPYVASEKKIPPEVVQEMMRRSLYHIKWYFAKTDLNTEKGKAENKKSIVKYVKWYTSEKESKYPTSFKVDFVGIPHEGACYYRITRCPICAYAKKLGVSELMPLFCELDEVMITLQHGVLHRKQTLADGGKYCDYYITGNKE